MKAMILNRTVSLDEVDQPLMLVELANPKPKPGELLVRVSACGVCHTELDEIEGRATPNVLPMVPGHEVVGRVEKLGKGVARHKLGDRVGVGWIHCSSGQTDENLSADFRATGRDANGGYAEFMTVPQDYAYPIPDMFSDAQAAPLLCAGAIGYRALKLAHVQEGELLRLMGFGGSGHLVLQLVRHLFPDCKVFVFARDQTARDLALELGAAWAGDTADRAPQRLHAIIDTTPAWRPVIESLKNLRPAGRLIINAIRKEEGDKDQLLKLNYQDHLWMERQIKTVANITQFDIREFLPIAAAIPMKPEVQTYRLEDANRALVELKRGPVRGAKVLLMD